MSNTGITLKERAKALKLYGLVRNWDEVKHQDWIRPLVEWEEEERQDRSLQRRLTQARIGRFKPLVDYDWQWPQQCDRHAIEELMTLEFLKEAGNIVLIGPNGVGKSTIARNIAHQSVIKGYTARFTTAGNMLNELAAQDSDVALQRRLKQYTKPDTLVIDEIGYLSYGNRHADLLFEIISRRYEEKSTVVTTNKPFSEWGDVFPNASCVVSLIDRLVHKAEIIAIEGESYRLKEAQERTRHRDNPRSLFHANANTSPEKGEPR
jgi:DNA replication protein DnaC